MKQLNIKASHVCQVCLVLFCALLITTHMVGGMYAKYAFSASATDQVRVAMFDVSCTSSDANSSKNLKIGSGETVTYSFTAKNLSDVSIQYHIVVENLPAGVVVEGNNGPFYLTYGANQKHTLVFSATELAAEVSAREISVKINATQVD